MSTSQLASSRETKPMTAESQQLLRTLVAGALGGALCGMLVGGVLGRIVMRILAAASSEHVQGLLTDDQAPVGEITLGGSLSLLMISGVLGGIGGLLYLLARRVLPRSTRWRMVLFGVFGASVGGGLFVHDYSTFDFSRLDPVAFAIVAFIALPGLFGVLVPAVVDWLLRPGGFALQPQLLWPVLAAVVTATFAMFVLLAAFAVASVIRRFSILSRLWDGPVITVVGVTLFAGIIVVGAVDLVVDANSIVDREPGSCPVCIL